MFTMPSRKQISTRNTTKISKKKFHIKDLTCLNCDGKICKCIEVRYCDSFDEVMDKAKELSKIYYSRKNINKENNRKVG